MSKHQPKQKNKYPQVLEIKNNINGKVIVKIYRKIKEINGNGKKENIWEDQNSMRKKQT